MSDGTGVSVADSLKKAAAALHTHVSPLLGQPHLEVEMRFCSFPLVPAPAEATLLPARRQGKDKSQFGVSEAHFTAMVEYLTRTIVTDKPDAPQPRTQTTEDIQLNGMRFTYVLPDAEEGDATSTLVDSMRKTRRLVEDVKMPRGRTYDVRFSVNTEDPNPTAGETRLAQRKAGAVPPPPPQGPVTRPGPGYRRRKHRISFTDGPYRYDCTRVQDSRGQQSFEVEVEGVFEDAQTELTREWVEGLLGRMDALMSVCHLKRERAEDTAEEANGASEAGVSAALAPLGKSTKL